MGCTDQAVLKLCSRSYTFQDVVIDEADSAHINIKLSLLLDPASLANRLASYLDCWHPGKKVAVLEARVIGGGQSGKDTGEISTWNNHTYKRLESLYGAEKTTRIAASQKAALDFVETVVKEKRINCGFSRQDAFVFFDSPSVGPEFKALLNAGLQDTKEVSHYNQPSHMVRDFTLKLRVCACMLTNMHLEFP